MSKSLEDSVVLIVDDTPENIDILNEVLNNYKRKVATNGERALMIANTGVPPDIILLDVMMPGMDGYEVCKRLKAEEHTKNIPVIFITAKSEVEDETKGLNLGAVDFITKPISPPIVQARVKNHLELQRSRLLLEEKNTELAQRNKYITDSINYAKRIQTAILPSKGTMENILPDHFILYRPKDIVSGDFYWINQMGDKKIIAVSDCTGHGVPGAFMSMIGNTLLNEIITVKRITDPAEILNHLDKGVIEELRKEEENSTFDGMDIGICVINEKEKQLEFAGAFRSLYIMNNGEFSEIKGVKKSIGDKSKKKNFVKSSLNYSGELLIYLTSDGYVDQHDAKGIKFGTRKLKELIKKHYKKSCDEQKDVFANELDNHKQDQIQRDDITIFCFKLNSLPNQSLGQEQKTTLIEFNGTCTHEALKNIGSQINEKLGYITSPQIIKKVFICSNELVQNIQFYSLDKTNINGNEIGSGKISISRSDSELYVETWNSIAPDKCSQLMDRINYLNGLDYDELKRVYKEKMRGESDEDSKGAGLGIMEIIRKTKNNVLVECKSLSEIKSEIHFKTVINMEN